jgi:hypothetical protein
MATATSKSLGALLLLVAAFALASCGGGGGGPSRPSEVAFVHPTSVPAGWSVAQLPSRIATMAYPGTWRRITSDPGTVSAAQVDARGVIVGYLNATPSRPTSHYRTGRPSAPTTTPTRATATCASSPPRAPCASAPAVHRA